MSVLALGNASLLAYLSTLQTDSVSSSSRSLTQLSASATLLSDPLRYSMVKLYPAKATILQCQTTSRLGVDIM